MSILSNLKRVLKDEFECKECGRLSSNKYNYEGYCEECKDITIYCSECGKECKIGEIDFNPIGAYCNNCLEKKYECKECGREIDYYKWKVCDGFCDDCNEELTELLDQHYTKEPIITMTVYTKETEAFECKECGREIYIGDMVEQNICKFCYRDMYGTDDPIASKKIK